MTWIVSKILSCLIAAPRLCLSVCGAESICSLFIQWSECFMLKSILFSLSFFLCLSAVAYCCILSPTTTCTDDMFFCFCAELHQWWMESCLELIKLVYGWNNDSGLRQPVIVVHCVCVYRFLFEGKWTLCARAPNTHLYCYSYYRFDLLGFCFYCCALGRSLVQSGRSHWVYAHTCLRAVADGHYQIDGCAIFTCQLSPNISKNNSK